jgi:hypothetical protein
MARSMRSIQSLKINDIRLMNYLKSIFGIILVSIIIFGTVFGQNQKAVERKAEQPKHLSEEEILKLLPKGAKFADDMPIIQPEGENAKKKDKQEYIYYADVNNDGIDEIIAAYYWRPADPGPNATETEKMIYAETQFTRAYIAVLGCAREEYADKWNSGGWGMHFQATIPAKDGSVLKEDIKYAINCFDVRDINGDGIPEIIATKISYYMCNCAVWSWDGETYKQIARTDMSTRIEDIDKDGMNELIVDYIPTYSTKKYPSIYKWNGKTYELLPEEKVKEILNKINKLISYL